MRDNFNFLLQPISELERKLALQEYTQSNVTSSNNALQKELAQARDEMKKMEIEVGATIKKLTEEKETLNNGRGGSISSYKDPI